MDSLVVNVDSSSGSGSGEQQRVEQVFTRWQKTFLGALDKQSEKNVVKLLKEGEDLLSARLLDINRVIAPVTGGTLLHAAAAAALKEVVEWLLQHGADPNLTNAKSQTPLMLCCEQANRPGALESIQLLVDYGGDLHRVDGEGSHSISKAYAAGVDVSNITKQIKTQEQRDPNAPQKADIDKANLVTRKLSTLFQGLESDGVSQAVDDAILRILTSNAPSISAGLIDISQPTQHGKTWLHLAINARRIEIAKLLINMNANVNAQDENGETPLHVVCATLDTDLSKQLATLLLDHGASLGVSTYVRGQTPLDYVAREDDKRFISEYQPKENIVAQIQNNSKFLTNKFLATALNSNLPSTAVRPPAAVPSSHGRTASSQGSTATARPKLQSSVPAQAQEHKTTSALQSMMGKAPAGNATAPSTSTNKSVSSTSTPSSRHTRTSSGHHRTPSGNINYSINYDEVFRELDVFESNSLTPYQIHQHHTLHHACSCPMYLVHQIFDSIPTCNVSNFADVLQSLLILCNQHQNTQWDWRLLDNSGTQTLSTPLAEVLWASNQVEVGAPKFEEFIFKRVKASKKPVHQIKWNDVTNELLKMPNLKEFS